MRYALYFAPKRDTILAWLGAHWLGRDAYTGEALRQPVIPEFDADLFAATTADPARYGFHATLKPPFRLAEGTTEERLLTAIEAFVGAAAPVHLDRIVVKRIGRFLALALAQPGPKLDSFAAAVVEVFDLFRSPPSKDEIERRSRSKLSAAQEAYLARWGYPYVMKEFRFHMTLTGSCDEAVLDRLEPEANVFFAEIMETPVLLDALTLFVEPAPGAPFRIAAQWTLTGRKNRPD
jgi:putative phosphonate metabolism protein